MNKKEEKKQSTKTKIPEEVIKQLIDAIDSELKGEFVLRHKLNELSPSFPYKHRTMANRDSLKTGPKGAFQVGKHIVYPKNSILQMLRDDLS